jgi:hypothetical protein
MAEKPPTLTFPRRDSHGRVFRLPEMLAAAAGGTVVGWVAVALISGIFALLGLGSFGTASGWLAVILPALLFFDDVRAWRPYPSRFPVALGAAVVAIVLGLLAAATVNGLPAIVSGAVGALVAACVYAPAWFLGIRTVTGEREDR